MITVGVDLGAEPKRTSVAALQWSDGMVWLTDLLTSADDAVILELAQASDKVGIDCPLGWPDGFVDFVNAHHGLQRVTPQIDAEARKPLRYRATDEWLVEEGLGRPLSVSSDLIGVCAMRAAGLLAAMTAAHLEIDRAGVSGRVAETYPAAAIRHWNLGTGRYKGREYADVLSTMVDQLLKTFQGRLDLGEFEDICRDSDDAFDAVICALVAKATLTYRGTTPVPPALISRARREGWIAVPTCRPLELLGPVGFEA